MSDEARLQEMIAAACLGAASEAAFSADLAAFLAAHGVSAEDAEAILASPPRLALYRRLVRANLTGVTEKMLRRTRARLGDRFDASFAAFLGDVGPRTPYLRDVPGEFLAWALPRWQATADVPAWAGDLARHELAQYQVGAAEGAPDAPLGEVALDRGVVLGDGARLLRYDFAVHELAEDDDRTEPVRRATALLAYRDEDDAVQLLELAPFAAEIVERLLGGAPVGRAVQDAAVAAGATMSEPLLGNVAQLLADLGARGALRGGRLAG